MELHVRLEEFLHDLVASDAVIGGILGKNLEYVDLDLMAPFFHLARFPAGCRLMQQGAGRPPLMFLLDGQARIERFAGDDFDGGRPPEFLNMVGGLDVLGELSLVLRSPPTADVVVVEPVVALYAEREDFKALYEEDPGLGLALLRWCATDVASKALRTQNAHRIPYLAGLCELPTTGESLEFMQEAAFYKANQQRIYRSPGPETTEEIRHHLSSLVCLPHRHRAVPTEVADLFRLFSVPDSNAVVVDTSCDDSLLLLVQGVGLIYGQPDEHHDVPSLIWGFRGGHTNAVHVMMGEHPFLLGGPRRGTIVARGTCDVLELDPKKVVDLLDLAPGLAIDLHLGVLACVAQKLLEMSEHRAIQQGFARGNRDLLYMDVGGEGRLWDELGLDGIRECG